MGTSKQGKYRIYSTAKKLKIAGKITEEFEVMLANLTLEELIALKLENAAKMINNKPYGLDLWHAIPRIARDAVLKFAISAAQTQQDACRILGIKPTQLRKLKNIYGIEEYFEKKIDKSPKV